VSEPLRIGVLGTAGINAVVVPAAAESPAVLFVSLASRDSRRGAAAAAELGIPHVHRCYEALLDDPFVEGVYISLPNSRHLEAVTWALEAGKHVLCEKPLSRDPEAVDRAFALAESKGLVLTEGLMYSHHPQTATIRRLVREGALGRTRFVRTSFRYRIENDAERRMLKADLDGGVLMYLGTYCIHATRLLAGEPEWVAGVRVDAPEGTDLAFHGTMGHPDEVIAQFDVSFVTPLAQELEVIGEEASVLATGPFRIDWGGTLRLRRGDAVEEIPVDATNPYRLEFENFAGAVRGEVASLIDRADSVGQATVLRLLLQSAEAGGTPVPRGR
jgi:D-xylose 1-dehydrogenase (NADP+, D-xylono-1,5-lactone-forming)